MIPAGNITPAQDIYAGDRCLNCGAWFPREVCAGTETK